MPSADEARDPPPQPLIPPAWAPQSTECPLLLWHFDFLLIRVSHQRAPWEWVSKPTWCSLLRPWSAGLCLLGRRWFWLLRARGGLTNHIRSHGAAGKRVEQWLHPRCERDCPSEHRPGNGSSGEPGGGAGAETKGNREQQVPGSLVQETRGIWQSGVCGGSVHLKLGDDGPCPTRPGAELRWMTFVLIRINL